MHLLKTLTAAAPPSARCLPICFGYLVVSHYVLTSRFPAAPSGSQQGVYLPQDKQEIILVANVQAQRLQLGDVGLCCRLKDNSIEVLLTLPSPWTLSRCLTTCRWGGVNDIKQCGFWGTKPWQSASVACLTAKHSASVCWTVIASPHYCLKRHIPSFRLKCGFLAGMSDLLYKSVPCICNL